MNMLQVQQSVNFEHLRRRLRVIVVHQTIEDRGRIQAKYLDGKDQVNSASWILSEKITTK